MLKWIARGLIWAAASYLIAAVATYGLVMAFSDNVHDRPVEASIMAVFAVGPVAATIGFVVGVLRRPR